MGDFCQFIFDCCYFIGKCVTIFEPSNSFYKINDNSDNGGNSDGEKNIDEMDDYDIIRMPFIQKQ